MHNSFFNYFIFQSYACSYLCKPLFDSSGLSARAFSSQRNMPKPSLHLHLGFMGAHTSSEGGPIAMSVPGSPSDSPRIPDPLSKIYYW